MQSFPKDTAATAAAEIAIGMWATFGGTTYIRDPESKTLYVVQSATFTDYTIQVDGTITEEVVANLWRGNAKLVDWV